MGYGYLVARQIQDSERIDDLVALVLRAGSWSEWWYDVLRMDDAWW